MSPRCRPLRRLALAVAAGAVATCASVAVDEVVPTVGPSGPGTASAAPADLGAGGEYNPLSPVRIFDTRAPGINDTAPRGKKPTSPAGSTFRVDVLGQGGVPDQAGRVLAVVLNVVVANPEGRGNLAIAPAGAAGGVSSLINFQPGRNIGNLGIVAVGADGAIDVKLTTPAGASRADVAVDVFGWIATSSAPQRGARLTPVGPGRILDTRTTNSPLGERQSVAIQVRGADSLSPKLTDIVPNRSSVTGVLINIAAINRQPGSRNSYVAATPTAVPAGSTPSTSNVNVRPGMVKAGLAIVPVGDDGRIHLFNYQGSMHLAVDVLGYLETGAPSTTRAGRMIPLASPFRVFDTRAAAFGNAPLGNGSAEDWSFKAFSQSVKLGGAGLGKQSALIGNLTGTDLRRVQAGSPVTTYMTLYPGNIARPTASNINVPEGENVPNMSLLKFGPATRDGVTDPYVVQAYNHAGSIHYLVDVYAVVLAD
jgi:hypothetical protein